MPKLKSVPWNDSLFALLRTGVLTSLMLAYGINPAHAATLTISANPASVTSGSASTLTWSSTGATSCAASGAWSGVKAASGSQSLTAPNGLSTYALNCSGPAGSAGNSVVIGAGATPPALYALNVSVSGAGAVTSNPSGIACGATCSASFPSGALVNLSATPATGYTFSGWSGACTGTGACTTTLSAARSVTAAFTTPPTPNTLCDSVGYSTEKFNLTAPYCLDMRDDDYLRYPNGNPVAIANGNASVSDEPTGSYDGGHAAKFVPPTAENYAGLGNFNFISGSVGNRMNIRYLVYWGYDAVQSGVKLNIVNDGVSTRPMVISREMRAGTNTTYSHNYMIPIPSQNVNEAPTIRDPGYPNNPTFFIAGASAPAADGNYAHQWVSWEFEIITSGSSPILNFYIHTRDGRVAFGPGNPYATHAWTAGAIDLVRASVGWYWGPGWTQTAESYVKISDVVISNSYIGPPSGFVQ